MSTAGHGGSNDAKVVGCTDGDGDRGGCRRAIGVGDRDGDGRGGVAGRDGAGRRADTDVVGAGQGADINRLVVEGQIGTENLVDRYREGHGGSAAVRFLNGYIVDTDRGNRDNVHRADSRFAVRKMV